METATSWCSFFMNRKGLPLFDKWRILSTTPSFFDDDRSLPSDKKNLVGSWNKDSFTSRRRARLIWYINIYILIAKVA